LTKTEALQELPNEVTVPLPVRYYAKRRLRPGTYREEFQRFYYQWLEWHYFPINQMQYAEGFESEPEIVEYIEDQLLIWPNFDFKIVDQDGGNYKMFQSNNELLAV
jgi:hypothetical protein